MPRDSQKTPEQAPPTLYSYLILDIIIAVVSALSRDFFARPSRYRGVPRTIAQVLSDFHFLNATHSPGTRARQRAEIYSGLFNKAFATSHAAVRGAALHLVEKATKFNEPILRQGFVDTLINFQGNLQGLQGPLSTTTDEHVGAIFERAVEVLQNESIAGIFGLPPVPANGWPMSSRGDWDAACLISEIARTTQMGSCHPGLNPVGFLALQRIAHYGSATISHVMNWKRNDLQNEQHARAVFESAYCWDRALRELHSAMRIGDVDARGGITNLLGIGNDLGVGTNGGGCLLWVCDDYLVCGIFPSGSIGCFYVEICWCAVIEV